MICTFAIAIAAVLYVLAVGHVHNASIDHAQAPLRSIMHVALHGLLAARGGRIGLGYLLRWGHTRERSSRGMSYFK